MTTINMVLRDKKRLSARQYLKLSPSDLESIRESRIIPPSLGDSSFGEIEIVYKLPRYEAVL